MTLIFERKTDEAGTHALIFGAGRFPHLDGSNQDLPEGLRLAEPVTSPPNNAAAIARFLIKSWNKLIPPLASIELLISPEDGSARPFDYPSSEEDPNYKSSEEYHRPNDVIESATGDRFKVAAKKWRKSAEENSENLALLYGSSHGFQGKEHVLLFEDVGSDPDEPWRNMLSIDHVRRNLFKRVNKRSIVFVDCCRNLLESSTESLDSISGRRIGNITQQEYVRAQLEADRAVFCLRASPFGSVAKATTEGLGFFTEALLRCFKGAAGINKAGYDWCIDPSVLSKAVTEAGRLGLNLSEKDFRPKDDGSDWVGPPLLRLDDSPRYPVRVQESEKAFVGTADLCLKHPILNIHEERSSGPSVPPLIAWVPPSFDKYHADGVSKINGTPLVGQNFVVHSGGQDIYLVDPGNT